MLTDCMITYSCQVSAHTSVTYPHWADIMNRHTVATCGPIKLLHSLLCQTIFFYNMHFLESSKLMCMLNIWIIKVNTIISLTHTYIILLSKMSEIRSWDEFNYFILLTALKHGTTCFIEVKMFLFQFIYLTLL